MGIKQEDIDNIKTAFDINGDIQNQEIKAAFSKFLEGTGSDKKYAAIINTTGTAAPVVNVREDELSAPISWVRQSQGIVVGTLVGEFTDNEDLVIFNNCYRIDPDIITKAYIYGNDEIWIETRDFAGALVDGELYNASLILSVKR